MKKFSSRNKGHMQLLILLTCFTKAIMDDIIDYMAIFGLTISKPTISKYKKLYIDKRRVRLNMPYEFAIQVKKILIFHGIDEKFYLTATTNFIKDESTVNPMGLGEFSIKFLSNSTEDEKKTKTVTVNIEKDNSKEIKKNDLIVTDVQEVKEDDSIKAKITINDDTKLSDIVNAIDDSISIDRNTEPIVVGQASEETLTQRVHRMMSINGVNIDSFGTDEMWKNVQNMMLAKIAENILMAEQGDQKKELLYMSAAYSYTRMLNTFVAAGNKKLETGNNKGSKLNELLNMAKKMKD